MKIIFLDIDGVLIPYGQRDNRVLDEKCVWRLKEIIAATGADVVLSSSWRIGTVREVITKMLGEWMVEILDVTPTEGRYRGHQIQLWLQQNKYRDQYLILDDEVGSFPDNLLRHAIVVDPYNGLTDADVDRAIEMLGADERWKHRFEYV